MVAYTKLSDAELLNMINSSNDAAFKELYQRYWARIRAFALKMTRNNNIFVDDLVQETFISLYQIKKEPDAEFNLESYLFQIIRRKVINYLIRDKRKDECFNSLAAHVNELSEPTDADLILEELQELIQKGIDQMPDKMKQIFLMSRKRFLKRHQIAAELDISEETVKKQIYYGNKFLRSMLKLILTLYFVQFLLQLNKFFSFFS
ncbi:sigma-70 family RNA polymerase sigma factor [Chitinophaga sp.]|uniref:RNA polymerase sigma factor n=1 Tax=Chitinophaga sp. TaxID=1869181 RepID=UPI0031DF7D88